MKSRSTLFLFLAVLVCGAGYFLAKKRVPSSEEMDRKGKLVFDLKSGDVDEIEIKGVDRDFLFQRKDRRWNLQRPLTVRANASEVEGILSSIEYLERRRRLSPKQIEEAKLTLADYGLEKPRTIAALKTAKGPIIVRIGNEARQGDNLYIQVDGDPGVFIVEKDLAARLGKKLEDYRERALFDFSNSQAERLQIKNGTKLLEFARTNDLWRIVQPLNARADAARVNEFLTRTSSLRAQDFLSDDPAASKEYGLDEPAQEVVVTLDPKEGVYTLLLGQKLKADAGKIAAKLKGSSSIVSIPASFETEAGKPLNDFRDRSLGFFEAADVREIEIKNRSNGVRLLKEGGSWKILQPELLDADKEAVDRLISGLKAAQIKEFSADVVTDLDKFGLKAPQTVIALRGRGSEGASTNSISETYLDLSLGREDAAKKLVYVKLGGEPSVYGLDLAEAAAMPKGFQDLRTRLLFEIKKENVQSCTQKKGKSAVTISRSPEGSWKLDESVQGVLNETAWQKFLNLLGRFEVRKIVGTALNATSKQYGLDAPAAAVSVTTSVDGKLATEELWVGRKLAPDRFYILWKNQLLVCEASGEMHETLVADWKNAELRIEK